MSSINGEFPEDRTVEIISNDSLSPNSQTARIAALEEENRRLISEKTAIEKQMSELNKSMSDSTTDNRHLLTDLNNLKSELKTLGSVAARASELEGEVSRLQHDLISVTSELDEVNRELNDVKPKFDGLMKEREGKGKEFEAVVKERDLLIEKLREMEVKEGEGKGREFEAVVKERDLLFEKLREMEVKEEEYLKGRNEKEKVIGNLRVEIEELKVAVGENRDVKKDVTILKGRVVELERKLEDKEMLINGFDVKEKESESIVVEGKSGGLMTGDISLIAGAFVCGVGLTGLVCYLKAKRN